MIQRVSEKIRTYKNPMNQVQSCKVNVTVIINKMLISTSLLGMAVDGIRVNLGYDLWLSGVSVSSVTSPALQLNFSLG